MENPHVGYLLGAGGIVAVVGTAFIALGTGTHGLIWTHVWFDAGFTMAILALLTIAVATNLHFRRKVSSAPRSSPSTLQSMPTPNSLTLGDIRVSGKSRLQIDSSAERFADEGTEITDEASVTGRHFPGRPDLLAGGGTDNG